MKAGNRDSFRPLFRAVNILPFYSQYIYIYIFNMFISETSGYSALVPHANTVPLLD
jgi:hypothetical protein